MSTFFRCAAPQCLCPGMKWRNQALFAWDTGAAIGADIGFGEAGGQASAAGTFRIRNVEATFRASGVFRKSLEVAVFAEDIGESLFDDIIGASTDEGGVLINLRCGGVSER